MNELQIIEYSNQRARVISYYSKQSPDRKVRAFFAHENVIKLWQRGRYYVNAGN